MKNKLVKMMALLTATTMVAAGVMGCGSDSSDASADANTDTTASDTTANADTTDGADLSGTVTLAGSTSMEKLANAMNEAFMEKITPINIFKIRASYGLSGWDGNLSHELWRQSYGYAAGYNFGENAGSVSGGSEKSQYFLSLGYFDQQGIVGGDYNKSNYNRWSVRSNSTHIIFEDKTRNFLNKVRVGVNIGYSRSTGSSIDANTEYGSILGSALTFSPLVPVYADEETAAAILAKYPNAVTDMKTGQVFSIPPAGFQEIANPVAMLNQRRSSIDNSDKFVSTAYFAFFGHGSVSSFHA